MAVLDADRPDAVVVARLGSPLLLGIGEHEMFLASDAAALVRYTKRVVHLDDGEIATVRADSFETATLAGSATSKTPSTLTWSSEAYGKDEFAHYMLKEIADQGRASIEP